MIGDSARSVQDNESICTLVLPLKYRCHCVMRHDEIQLFLTGSLLALEAMEGGGGEGGGEDTCTSSSRRYRHCPAKSNPDTAIDIWLLTDASEAPQAMGHSTNSPRNHL